VAKKGREEDLARKIWQFGDARSGGKNTWRSVVEMAGRNWEETNTASQRIDQSCHLDLGVPRKFRYSTTYNFFASLPPSLSLSRSERATRGRKILGSCVGIRTLSATDGPLKLVKTVHPRTSSGRFGETKKLDQPDRHTGRTISSISQRILHETKNKFGSGILTPLCGRSCN
jgi:hypothetical protein